MSVRRSYRIAALPGDGIGPEVTAAAAEVAEFVAADSGIRLDIQWHPVGGAAIDAHGDPLPASTLDACRSADAVLLGAVGGPEWDALPPDGRPEKGLLRLRSSLDLFANLRPVQHDALDILIVRELTGGIYFGKPSDCRQIGGEEVARDSMVYSRSEIERVANVAFELARKRRSVLTSVDKANVLATSRLWRQVVNELHAAKYPDVELRHEYVDIAAMKLVTNPGQFDVLLTGNLFGDILSDLAAALPGSIGLLPSASIGENAGLFEPVHGSAPDIAGTGRANPIGMILSAAMMFEFLEEPEAAQRVRDAVSITLGAGAVTADMAAEGEPFATTAEMTNEILTKAGNGVLAP